MNAWDFAIALWARPGVEARCLALQRDHGQCVPLLLWGLWTVAQARDLDDEAMARGADVARTWTDEVIAPLRAIRTGPRRLPAAVAKAVLAAELAAERALLEALEPLAATRREGHQDAAVRLVALCRAWGSPAPMAELAALVETL